MEFKFILGVDMSKDWFNYCLMTSDFEIVLEGEVVNTEAAILAFISQLLTSQQVEHVEDFILVMEHTGIYTQNLVRAWLSQTGRLSLVHATKVSEHLGGQMGWEEKTDQLDARRLAEYGIRYADKLVLHQAKSDTLIELQCLQRQRSRLLKVIQLLEQPVQESDGFDAAHITQMLQDNQAQSMKALKQDLKNIEKQLKALIEQAPELKQLFKLITSVEGVGPVIAIEVIIATAAFTDFTPQQAKSFARYVGIVPRKRQSGKSTKKARIGQRAHKKIKAALTMGATSLIGTNKELAQYYQRKINQGKAHLCVINAMRNKLVLRIFAVVRNQIMYQHNRNIYLELP